MGSPHIQPKSAFPYPLGYAEVGHHKVAIGPNKEVRRFYIPRDQSVTVDEPYRANDIAIVEATIYLVEGSELVNELVKASVRHQFEDEREVGRV